MSGVISALKVRFSADNSRFKSGMDENKKAMRDFKSQAGGDMSKLAELIGVDIGRITESFKTAQASLALMGTGFKGAAVGSGVLSSALKILKVALISTGIGAIVVALGSLIAYLSKTKDGVNLMKQAWAAVGAIFDVLIDRMAGFGQGLWNILKGLVTFDFETVRKGADQLGKSVKGIGDEMKQEATAAYKLKQALNDLEQKEVDLSESIEARQTAIERLRLAAKDETKDAQERLKAIRNAQAIEKSILDDQLAIARERARIIDEQKALGNNLIADDKELADAKIKVHQLERESLKLQRRLQSEVNTLTREIEGQVEAYKKLDQAKSKYIDTVLKSKGLPKADLSAAKSTLAEMKVIQKEVTEISINLSGIIQSTLIDVGASFAGMLGELAVGLASTGDFKNSMLKILTDAGMQAGKVIMAAGLAFFAIGKAFQKALSTPAAALAAVAAGAALIAVSAAAQASLTQVASGGGGAGIGYSPRTQLDTRTNSNYETQNNTIQITGELTAKGRDLALVLNKEVNRKNLTT